MPRPPLPVGTFGKTLFLDLPNGAVEARVKYRDHSGRVVFIAKHGRTRPAAERALKAKLAERAAAATSGGGVSSSTHVSALADTWLAASHSWSAGTRRVYESVVKNQVKPTLGALHTSEVTPGVVSRALAAVAAQSGPSTAKTMKACLSGMFHLAIQDGALTANPVRDAGVKLTVPRRSPRALTLTQTTELTDLLRASPRAVELDLPDLVDFMLATGCRIGEALAARYTDNSDGKPTVDLKAATWEVNATVVRVPGAGLVIQPRPKTAAGWRVLALPTFAVELLRRRQSDPKHANRRGLVFGTPFLGTLRDPSNTSGDLRVVLDGFDCQVCDGTGYQLDRNGRKALGDNGRPIRCDAGPWSWVTSHTFRKTVGTRLDEAGLTARQAADQLGHANPSMTLDVYYGRRVVSAAAAKVLDR